MTKKMKRYVCICLCILVASLALPLDLLPLFSGYSEHSGTVSAQLLPIGDQDGSIGTNQSQSNIQLFQTLETITKGIYLIMWPALAVAGASIDNSLVYGKVFFLDTTLRKFRQIIRTFANYTLGFLVIGSVLLAFFKQNSDQQWVGKLFKRLVLAGVLINMSRWLVASMIDLSTIGVVGLGGMPLHVMGQSGERDTTIRYLKPVSFLDLSPGNDERADQVAHSVIHSCAGNPVEEYYLPCSIENGRQLYRGTVGEELGRYEYKQQVIDAWKELAWQGAPLRSDGTINVNTVTINEDFCVYGNTLITNDYGSKDLGDNCTLDTYKQRGMAEMVAKDCATMSDLMTKAADSTGPLYTLYGSIFHMSRVALTTNKGSIAEVTIEMGIKVIVGLALVIPLLALAVILVVRVVVLWLIIAFSPLLVLAYVFEFKAIESAQGGKLSIGSIVSLIFLPVFAVFAVSISVVFLSFIGNIEIIEGSEIGKAEQSSEQQDSCNNDAMTAIGGSDVKRVPTSEPEKCYDFLNIQTVCFSESDRTTGSNIVNVLVRTVINFFGIALMRTTIFFVLKSNKITGKIAGAIESIAATGLKSIPLVPVGPGGELMPVGSIQKTLNAGNLTGKLDNYQRQQMRNSGLDDLINGAEGALSGDRQRRVSELSSNPSRINTMRAGNGESVNTYNSAVPNLVSHINQQQRPDGQRYNIQGNPGSMNDLMRNPEFVNYTQNNGGSRDFLSRMDPAGRSPQNSTAWRNGLAALAQSQQQAGQNNIMRTANAQDGSYTEYIYANGRWTALPWQRTGRGNAVAIDYANIREITLGDEGITSEGDLRGFTEIMQGFGTIQQLPQDFRNRYWTHGGADSLEQRVGNPANNDVVDVQVGANANIPLTVQVNNTGQVTAFTIPN